MINIREGGIVMLKNVIFPERPGEEELKARLKAAREKLAGQQTLIKEHKLPVLVLVEGWGTAGKGSVIGQMIRNIDPRFFKVAPMDQPTEEEKRKPFLCRYFTKIPEAGKFMFLDSGWMDEVTRNRVHGEMDQKTYEQRIDSIRRFERQLTDNGYLVMKFFCHISVSQSSFSSCCIRIFWNHSCRIWYISSCRSCRDTAFR